MLKRITSLILCLLFAASSLLLVACSDESDENSQSNMSGEVSVGTSVGFLNDKKDWGGEVVNILSYEKDLYQFSSCQIDAEELIDEPVNDALYERNAYIESNFGIDIVAHYAGADEKPVQMLRDDMTSGLNEYDAMVAQITYAAPLAIEGLLVDFNALENGYMHLDQVWWDQPLQEDLSINGHCYFITGDALIEDDQATWAMYFNKDVVQKLNLEDPYQLVREDKWTLDNMYEMLKKYDLMHGATKSYDPSVGDQWGMVAQSYDFYILMQGCGQTLVDNTGEKPVLRVDSERNIQVFNKLSTIIYDARNVGVADHFGAWDSGVYAQQTQIFVNGNALFMPSSISTVGSAAIRDAEIRYGILPLPKADDLQDEYTTSVNVYQYSVFCIPKTNIEKLDVTCYALEAMAYYGKEMVTPEYYDRTLTYKRFTDDDSAEMLDLIFRNRTYDMGSAFNFNGGTESQGTLYFFTGLLGNRSTDIMSHFESKKSGYQVGIDDLIEICYND